MAALSTVTKTPVPTEQEARWTPDHIWMLLRRRKSLYHVGKGPTIHRPSIIQPRHYTDCNILAFQMDVK
jgi:hypothetical protein